MSQHVECRRGRDAGADSARFSVIIPAYNEANVIGGLLGALREPAECGDAEVVVVCNGCADATAEIARDASPAFTVLETDFASKANALNLGDDVATTFPRLYIDADLRVAREDIERLCDAMEETGAAAGTVGIAYDTTGATWIVRRFYDLWKRLPYAVEQKLGVGLYALSRQGRSRFDRFPETYADDLYVQMQFDAAERMTVAGTRALVPAPSNLAGLVRCRARQYLGKREVRTLMPRATEVQGARQARGLMRLALRPRWWFSILLFVSVRTAAVTLYFWSHRLRGGRRWVRSRVAMPPPLVPARAGQS